jgi:hypothetical protein
MQNDTLEQSGITLYTPSTHMGLMGVYVIISPDVVHSRRVPSLACYVDAGGGTIILLIGCLSGMVFGGIHCAGWNFPFQRHAEQVLWRAASPVILRSPIFSLISYMFQPSDFLHGIRYFDTRRFAYIAACLTLIYLFSSVFNRCLPAYTIQ